MIALSSSIRSIAFAAVASLMLGAPLRAQDATLASAPAAPAAVAAPAAQVDAAPVTAAGPTNAAAAVGVRRTPAETAAPVPAGGYHDRGTALMIVGGAAILTGIVIGNGAGYAISVGGAVIGLYGLYLYLQ